MPFSRRDEQKRNATDKRPLLIELKARGIFFPNTDNTCQTKFNFQTRFHCQNGRFKYITEYLFIN